MKNFLLITLFFAINLINAQDWSKVYRQVEEVTLNDGLEKDYEKFEGFWKTIKQKHVKEGKLMGWFIWKVDPKGCLLVSDEKPEDTINIKSANYEFAEKKSL